jgi:hypothetical protein
MKKMGEFRGQLRFECRRVGGLAMQLEEEQHLQHTSCGEDDHKIWIENQCHLKRALCQSIKEPAKQKPTNAKSQIKCGSNI